MSQEDRYRTGRRSKVIDLRGRVLPLLQVEDLPRDASKELRRAVQRANQHRWKAQVQATLMFVLSIGCVQFVLGGLGAVSSRGWVIQAVTTGVLSLFFGTLGGAALSRESGREAVTRCLRLGMCPSCGYGLKELVTEGDGARVCPECGGAWRIDD